MKGYLHRRASRQNPEMAGGQSLVSGGQMSEMVEQVAAGIVAAHDKWMAGLKHPMVDNPEYRQRLAKAAIKAMREPTVEMCKAQHRGLSSKSAEILACASVCRMYWQAMIDEALK